MKIISVSDIITNSSSEVFCVYDKHTFDKIIEIINTILATFGIDNKFDELFELVPEYSDDAFEDGSPDLDEAFNHDSCREGYPYIIGYHLKSKDSKYGTLARKLSNLDHIFNYEEFYC